MNLRVDWILDEDPVLCYKEGFRAFVKQVGKGFANPYRAGTEAHRAFQDGWQFARSSIVTVSAGARHRRKNTGAATSPVLPHVPLPMARTH